MNSLKVLQKLLTTFGNLIHLLKINFDKIESNHATEIVKSVNDRTSNTLKSLYLTECYGKVLDELKNQFSEVFTLSITTAKHFEFSDKNRKLNQLFPNIQFFLASDMSVSEWTFIDGEFPFLNSFHVKLSEKTGNAFDESHIASFLKKNTQIKEISIIDSSLKALKDANDILSNLNSLEIDGLSKNYGDDKIDSVHFKNVKKLRVIANVENEIPQKVVFDQVDDLFIKTQNKFSTKWFDFISNQIHSKVNSFKLETVDLTKDQLLTIPNKMPDLKAVIVQSPVKFANDEVVDFVQTNKHLETLELIIKMDKADQDKLEKTLEKDWTVVFAPEGSDGNVKILIKGLAIHVFLLDLFDQSEESLRGKTSDF